MFIKSISESKANTFTQCNLKYKFKYVDKYEEMSKNKDALDFGSYIHKIFELGVEKTSLEDLFTIAEECKKDYKITEEKDKKTETCLRNFLRFNASLTETVGTELVYEIKQDEKNDISLNGIIDRIVKSPQGEYLVIDYKTGKRELKKHELYQNHQMQGYAFAVSKVFKVPLEKVTVAHYYPVTGNLVSLKYSWAQISSYLRNKVETVWKIRKKKKDEFQPSKNEYCWWCGYSQLCPEFSSPQKITESLKYVKKSKRR
jgi:DNA helicase-2/ATP-dependent DNA helicase PcrA